MKKNLQQILIVAALVFVAAFIYFIQKNNLASSEYMAVSFLDVGQGDAIFIEAPNGVQMLIDSGPDNSVLQELSKVMPFWDRSIDVVVATHPDKDHIGGFPELFKRFKVGYVLDTEVISDTGIYREYLSQREKIDAKKLSSEAGQVIVLDKKSGVYVEVLFPGENIENIKDKNDTSIVLRVVYGESEVLLTGDASKKVEKFLVSKYGSRLESDILKLGHHGSKTSTSESFLETVSPKMAVVSAGEGNRYGHPHDDVVDKVKNLGLDIYSTSEGRPILMEISPTEIFFK
ncbi:MAG: competence protein ComEC [Candidatus Paceibacteria bacterium]|jgi:competence protein ComEC